MYYWSSYVYFNPRSRKESDSPSCAACIIAPNFNPRSRKESDRSNARNFSQFRKFQSTLSQGERRLPLYWRNAVLLFQSTLSQGERRGDAVYANKKRIDHWLKTLSLAGAPNGSLVVDSFNLSRIIPDETDLGKLFQSTLSQGERPIDYPLHTD